MSLQNQPLGSISEVPKSIFRTQKKIAFKVTTEFLKFIFNRLTNCPLPSDKCNLTTVPFVVHTVQYTHHGLVFVSHQVSIPGSIYGFFSADVTSIFSVVSDWIAGLLQLCVVGWTWKCNMGLCFIVNIDTCKWIV